MTFSETVVSCRGRRRSRRAFHPCRTGLSSRSSEFGADGVGLDGPVVAPRPRPPRAVGGPAGPLAVDVGRRRADVAQRDVTDGADDAGAAADRLLAGRAFGGDRLRSFGRVARRSCSVDVGDVLDAAGRRSSPRASRAVTAPSWILPVVTASAPSLEAVTALLASFSLGHRAVLQLPAGDDAAAECRGAHRAVGELAASRPRRRRSSTPVTAPLRELRRRHRAVCAVSSAVDRAVGEVLGLDRLLAERRAA